MQKLTQFTNVIHLMSRLDSFRVHFQFHVRISDEAKPQRNDGTLFLRVRLHERFSDRARAWSLEKCTVVTLSLIHI